MPTKYPKTREFTSYDGLLGEGRSTIINGSQVVPNPAVRFICGGKETISGSGHPWPPRKRKHVVFGDIGGPMVVQRNKASFSPGLFKGESGSFSHAINNGHHIPSASTAFTTLVKSSYWPKPLDSTMLAKGSIGWSRFKPTKAKGNLGQALGELHDLPRLPALLQMKDAARLMHKEHRSRFSNLNRHNGSLWNYAGSEYLNWVFGWMPLIADIQDLCSNVKHFRKKVLQLARDNGQPVRRSGYVARDSTTTTSSRSATGTSGSGMVYPGPQVTANGAFTETTEITEYADWRFSARFKYWLPVVTAHYLQDSTFIPPRELFQLSRVIFGLDPTDISLYYELTPWSWLADWIAPVGSVLDNLWNDSVDHLIADYAYMSSHSGRTTTYTVQGSLVGGEPSACSATLYQEAKYRLQASPYGFGVSMTGLSPSQTAILAAIGFSRA